MAQTGIAISHRELRELYDLREPSALSRVRYGRKAGNKATVHMAAQI